MKNTSIISTIFGHNGNSEHNGIHYHLSVNRSVVGSSPTIGAKNPLDDRLRDFSYYLLLFTSCLSVKQFGIFEK